MSIETKTNYIPDSDASFKEYVFAELRKGDEIMAELVKKMNAIELEQAESKAVLAANTASTNNVEKNTQEMLDVFQSWKGAMKVLEQIGRLAKPLGYILAMGAGALSIWTAIKTGQAPR